MNTTEYLLSALTDETAIPDVEGLVQRSWTRFHAGNMLSLDGSLECLTVYPVCSPLDLQPKGSPQAWRNVLEALRENRRVVEQEISIYYDREGNAFLVNPAVVGRGLKKPWVHFVAHYYKPAWMAKIQDFLDRLEDESSRKGAARE